MPRIITNVTCITLCFIRLEWIDEYIDKGHYLAASGEIHFSCGKEETMRKSMKINRKLIKVCFLIDESELDLPTFLCSLKAK